MKELEYSRYDGVDRREKDKDSFSRMGDASTRYVPGLMPEAEVVCGLTGNVANLPTLAAPLAEGTSARPGLDPNSSRFPARCNESVYSGSREGNDRLGCATSTGESRMRPDPIFGGSCLS